MHRVSILIAIVLGIIQGLTEFLPISSTAHLTLAGKLLGTIDVTHPESWTAFIAIMQLGTMTAVIVYFWRDVVRMIVATVKGIASGTLRTRFSTWPLDLRLAATIVVGTLPVAVIGFSARHIIEGALTKSIPVIASSLIILAALLWIAEKVAKHQRPLEQLGLVDGFLIGVAQTLALIPGSSRSGTTITGGLFLGLTREAAARFSFLLSIPAVFGSGLFEVYEAFHTSPGGTDVSALGIPNLAVSTLVSGVCGYFAIAWLLRYLMKNTTMIFVWYRLALGALLLLLLAMGAILP